MADKEERILIARSSDYTLTDTDKGELFEGKIAPHCANVFTRQEAIEKMAKGIFTQIWGLPNNRFDLAKSSVKVRNRKLAEAALNELLESNDNEK